MNMPRTGARNSSTIVFLPRCVLAEDAFDLHLPDGVLVKRRTILSRSPLLSVAKNSR